MDLSIKTEYSLWFIPVCLIGSLLITYFLYRKDSSFNEVAKWKIRLLFVLRFVFIFFISFLLLSPLIKSLKQNIQKPIILIAQDNSGSIIINKDSSFYKNEYPAKLNKLVEKLENKYELKTLSFGNVVSNNLLFDYNGKLSNYTNLFNEIKQLYSNRNIGALILASDGIYNNGSNPLYDIKDFDFPVYTLALGDTGTYKDIAISELNYNKIAFLGNKFPVRVYVDIKKLNGVSTELKLVHNKQVIFKKNINVSSDNYFEEINFEITATAVGVQHYLISLTPNDEEINVKNNFKDIVVDVIDGKQKILLLSNSSHPDISAIKNALETNDNFDLTISNFETYNDNITDYNLVILHQLPTEKYPAIKILNTIFTKKIPVLFIMGGQVSMRRFNNLNTGFRVDQSKNRFEESTANLNKEFILFRIDKETEEFLKIVPPLITPFGEYKLPANSNVLIYQQIIGINTSKPLIAFTKTGEQKIGIIAGEGIWRWRIYDYIHNSTHNNFDVLINKIFQYLALKVSKKKFIVNFKNIYSELDPLIFNAEIYNDNYELINESEVNIEIVNSEKQKFPYVFNKSTSSYMLNAGNFPAGDYTFKASTKIKDDIINYSGKFTVIDVSIEAQNTNANHKLLYQIAENTNGKLYYPDDILDIYDEIINNKNIVPVSYSEKNLMEVINIKLIFFLLILFITVEWFLRKYFGSY